MQSELHGAHEISIIEKKIGYKFIDKQKLMTALTHTSYSNEHKQDSESYERYEFLGDSILSYVTSKYIFTNLPNLSEGNMTKLRASVVCEKALVQVMNNLGVGAFIRLSKGEAKSSGGVRDSILADVFEALSAAIFLDGGFSQAEQFIIRNVAAQIKAGEDNGGLVDYKTLLQEYAQHHNNRIDYELISSNGPEHEKEFLMRVVINNKKAGEGRGRSKKEATQNAARDALEKSEHLRAFINEIGMR